MQNWNAQPYSNATYDLHGSHACWNETHDSSADYSNESCDHRKKKHDLNGSHDYYGLHDLRRIPTHANYATGENYGTDAAQKHPSAAGCQALQSSFRALTVYFPEYSLLRPQSNFLCFFEI